jgi:hypothetical protein
MIPVRANPNLWSKPCYIASKIGVVFDDEGNEIAVYNTPKKYIFNYRAISSDADLAEFGEKANITQRMVIDRKYEGLFKEFDVAYLYDATPDEENRNGDNANYVLLPPRIGNSVIIIYMQKILGK